MADFSKQWCERNDPSMPWDFDILEVADRLKPGYCLPYICEGYGFTVIAKSENDQIQLGFPKKDGINISYKSYKKIVGKMPEVNEEIEVEKVPIVERIPGVKIYNVKSFKWDASRKTFSAFILDLSDVHSNDPDGACTFTLDPSIALYNPNTKSTRVFNYVKENRDFIYGTEFYSYLYKSDDIDCYILLP